ncbi:hypothetical protein BN1708_000084 [Verticillium longisporum]|uniref:Uncharacterized protein n=1 Tax=Verticillium longisporum TaxID=100787 RepID=A0A0G4KDF1_VERLO|nr:hypothetical protein BN1708_000084 [Verticillium longisporum]
MPTQRSDDVRLLVPNDLEPPPLLDAAHLLDPVGELLAHGLDGEPSLKLWAQTLLVEDRADQGMSAAQWLGILREKVMT